ncbi:MAG: hypothetical protein KF699_15810 [Phycisphaeraceae bacterium]|nr:hypothetical protein [Phycisphaeraceae bacterium]
MHSPKGRKTRPAESENPASTDHGRHRFEDALAAAPAQAPSAPQFDRRLGIDRREIRARITPEGEMVTGEEGTGLERRRGPGRRRTDFMRSAEEGEMSREQFLFLMAIDAFKKANDVLYPTWTDVLEVVRLLGYRKTMPSELSIRGAEDFQEAPDSLNGVRAKPGHPELRREAA